MSNRVLVPFVLIGTFAITGAALASEQANGEITRLNPSKHLLTLSDGQTYRVAKAIDFKSLQLGETVDVTYDFKGKQRVASEVMSAMPQVFENTSD